MADKHPLVEMNEARQKLRTKSIVSVAICAMGAISMIITGGKTGVGGAILGLYFIWS